MKKIYSALLAGAVVLTATASYAIAEKGQKNLKIQEGLELQTELRPALAPATDKSKSSHSVKAMKQTNLDRVQRAAKKGKIAKAAPETIVGNTYVTLYNDGEDELTSYISVAAGTGANGVVFKNFAEGYDVNGTYDPSTGEISIPTGVTIGTYGNYGDVLLYSLNSEGRYSATIPITGKVVDDDIVFDTGVYAAVSAGGLAIQFDLVARTPNATYKGQTTSKSIELPMLVTKTAEDQITVTGIGMVCATAVFNGRNSAMNYSYPFTLNSYSNTATSNFNTPIDNYGTYGNFYYGMIEGGYIVDLSFNVAVSGDQSVLSTSNQTYCGYRNGTSYSGAYITNVSLTIDMDVFNAEVAPEEPEVTEEWIDKGNALFKDGWVLPLFGIDQNNKDYWYEVPLQQNAENPNLYRLVDPYHQAAFPLVQYNESRNVGSIEFDVTDPDHVLVNPRQKDAGFAFSSVGISKFYPYNTLQFFINYYGLDASTIVNLMGEDMPYTTYKDGIVTLGYIDSDGEPWYDANFGDQDDNEGGYGWNDSQGNSADMSAMIIFPGATEPWTPGEDDYVVYNNGVVDPDLHIYGWWNDVANFKAPNPAGSGEAFEFKAADGGAAASMGLNMEAPQNTGMLHDATLNFNWYATTAATYTIRLTSVATENYTFTPTEDQLNKWNTTSLNVAKIFPTVAAEWDANKNLGEGYVFSVILENGTQGSVIYFDKVYYSNVDTEWEAPVVVIPTPENVPAPTQPSENVFSFFSNYGNNVSYGIGGWGQTTQCETIQVDGKDIIRLRNFNYLGWDNFNINISDYDYMHVDYWTPDEEAVFGFVPISLNPTKDTPIWEAPEVKANQWNSYDAPLSDFDADMTKIEQIKFVANLNDKVNSEYGYIANVYFYKESKGGAEVSGNLTTQMDMSMGTGEEPELLPVDTYSVTATYNQTANTITLSNYVGVSEDISSGLEGLNPLQLTIDIEKGTVIATGEQVSSVDDYDPEEPLTYYYMDITTQNYGVSGTIANLNDEQCIIKLNPWGEGDIYPGFGFFTMFAYYNTEIVLDLNIEGLAYAPQASIDNLKVKADGNDINLTIEYSTNYVPEGSKVYAEIFDVLTGEEVPVFDEPKELVQNPTVVTIPNATYVDGQVASHNYRVVLVVKDSEGETVVTATKETGITTSVEGIQVESENQVRYYNMQGVEVAEPSNGVFIKVEGTKKTKVLVK